MDRADANPEQTLLNHYNLTTLYPTTWPADKDEEDDALADDDAKSTKSTTSKPSARAPTTNGTTLAPPGSSPGPKSYSPSSKARNNKRYTMLERGPETRRSAQGAQKSKQARENQVLMDEPDPLGLTPSVSNVLRHRGLPVENDPDLRNRFMLSSTSFSPSLFISQVHSSVPTEHLLHGLDLLSESIDNKSAALKILVESNFERFVRAKATIDNVYKEMRDHGTEPGSPSKSRHTSRPSNSLRSASNSLLPGDKRAPNDKKKNALLKESEYGTLGIKAALKDATAKAEEVWGPALGGREREEALKSVMASIEQNRHIFEAGAALEDAIKRRDYEALAEQYTNVQTLAKDAKTVADRARDNRVELSDAQVYQIVLTGRIWMDAKERIEEFKRNTWKKLANAHVSTKSMAPDNKQEEFMEMISILLQLGVDDNPVVIWLYSRYDYLRNKISRRSDRIRLELEVQRRKLASVNRPSSKTLASYLRIAADKKQKSLENEMDSSSVVQFWGREVSALNSLLSTKGGLLGEITEYWETTLSFIEGMRQRSLPIGIDGSSRKHHRLSREIVKDLQEGAADLFSLLREKVHGLFVEPPLDDVTSLFSPPAQTPKTPHSASLLSPRTPTVFSFDPKDIPPLAPPTPASEQFDKFAFWPPQSNSLSGSTYLSKANNIIASAAAELASVDLIKQDSRLLQQFRTLVGDVRERSISAVCIAWVADSENCRELEDWTRSPDSPDLTNMPARFNAFETALLTNLQRIMYVPDAAAANGSGSGDVVTQPTRGQNEVVQRGFRNSMYKAFNEMMEHAKRPAAERGGDIDEMVDLTIPATRDIGGKSTGGGGVTRESIDVSSSGTRKLLTIANFQTLRSDIVPALFSSFESNFLLTMTNDAQTAKSTLEQLNARVFHAYVKPTTDSLKTIITNGILEPTYGQPSASSGRPSDARPYIYTVLLTLVLIHNTTTSTTPSLTPQLLSYLLEQISSFLISAFQDPSRPRYSLTALMQATLDVEFLAQTLDNYTTAKAGQIQSEIYLALDARTDNEARQKLQEGLPEMRSILKRLREGTKGEFGCFRRVRHGGRRDREKDKDRGPETPVA